MIVYIILDKLFAEIKGVFGRKKYAIATLKANGYKKFSEGWALKKEDVMKNKTMDIWVRTIRDYPIKFKDPNSQFTGTKEINIDELRELCDRDE